MGRMYTLHIGNKNYSSWSLRPWVLMREKSIAFHEKLHVFGPKWAAKAQFGAPANKVPVLVDGERIVWDSLAIAEYLAEKHAGLWPAEREDRAWARSLAAEMHSGFGTLRNECSMNCGIRVQLHSISPALQADIDRIGEAWTEGLERFRGPFLAGREFTIVDAFFAPVAFRVQTYGLKLPPPAADYAKRLLALPSMKEWYAAALKEPYRDLPHEEETPKFGKVTQDLRTTSVPA
jgi:glutathione S-transferase